MVDPRIYRAGLALVAISVIVFGFSLQARPGPETTSVAPPAYTGPLLKTLNGARERGHGGAAFARYVARKLAGAVVVQGTSGFTVAPSDPQQITAQTAVTASRAGVTNGTIVVVSDRDAAGSAGVSGTAVLIALAHALAGGTQNHSIMLVSIAGETGTAGATALARSLVSGGQPVDAVIVLGDLAASHPSEPVVAPFSDAEALAPPVLSATLAHYLAAQTGISGGGANFGAQLAHLAFPLTLTDQGPFAGDGIPAVLVSLAGDQLTGPHEPTNGSRPGEVFAALMQTLDALDASGPVPSPSAYLVLSGKLVPAWAVRLLVLVLILPVLLATVDAFARTRRRGHSVTRWLVWVLGGALPFLVVAAVVRLGALVGLISGAPPGLVAAGSVALRTGGTVVIVAAAILWLLTFFTLRPLLLRLLLDRVGSRPARRPTSPAGDGAAVALSVVMCAAAVVVWVLNPFAAALLVPALHLWLWLAQAEVRARRWLVALLVVAGILPAVALVAYYAHSFGLMSPVQLVWSATLLLAGGGVSPAATLYWSVTAGCLVGAVIIAVRASHSAAALARVEPVVTVRGPVSYAGPGSLGGTKSALRR
jgi:hypothetical protein